MKVFLDDVRQAPDGWFRCTNAWRCIDLLRGGEVTHLSLDHDVGYEETVGNGHDVLAWILGAATYGFKLPDEITIHSQNSRMKTKMMRTIEKIEQLRFNPPI